MIDLHRIDFDCGTIMLLWCINYGHTRGGDIMQSVHQFDLSLCTILEFNMWTVLVDVQ